MLNVNYYNQFSEILDAELPSDLLVVCSDPTTSDNFREMTNGSYESITIARWLGQLSIPNDYKKVGKSELMLRLSSAFRNYFPDNNGNLFYNAFEIFTELRSFSLDINILVQVLNELDEEIAMAIKVFMASMESLKLVDEHYCYHAMKELEHKRPILFLGFKHFSSIQIDMMKTIADSTDIYLFIPASVKLNAINTDWVNWLDTEEVEETSNYESKKLEVVFYPTKKLNLYLNSYLAKEPNSTIALMGGNDNIFKDQEILLKPFGFKESVDLFQIDRDFIFDEILTKNFTQIEELLKWLEENEKNLIKSGEYRKLKINQLLVEAAKIYAEYHNGYDRFVHILLAEVVSLNSPRNYFINLTESNLKKLKFDEIKYQLNDQKIVLIFDKDSSPFKNTLSKYSEEVQAILKSIGPIRRKGLDILFLKNELESLIQTKNLVMFFEAGMDEVDPGVRELKKKHEFQLLDIGFEQMFKPRVDLLKVKSLPNETKTYSASKLQTYHDCPRKYYTSYIDRIDDQPEMKIGINPDELGNLEHIIVEEYSKDNSELNLHKLKELCQKHLNDYITRNQLIIPSDEYNEIFFEILEYTKNGVDFVLEVKKENPGAQFEFEFPLPANKFNLKGFIDFIVIKEDSVQIYDFKRSGSSIGTKKELQAFDKLQLWIYAICWDSTKKCTKIGYVNFSDNEGNVLLELDSQLTEFENVLSKLIDRYNNEVEYAPCPRKENVCRYCAFQKFCFKEVV